MHRLRIPVIVLLALMLCAVLFSSSAEFDSEGLIKYQPGEVMSDGLQIKKKLWENGYYPEDVDVALLQSAVLDDTTMVALDTFALTYPEVPDYNGHSEGITNKAWNDLKEKYFEIKNIAPEEEAEPEPEYVDLHMGDADPNGIVSRLIRRLDDLGFLNMKDADYVAGRMSPPLFRALEQCLNENGLSDLYVPDVITADAQEIILDDPQGVIKAHKLTFVEKMKKYFMGKSTFFGLGVPVLALWCVGVLLLAGIVVAFTFFFKSPSGEEAGAKNGAGGHKRISTRHNRRNSKVIRFEISWNGETRVHEQAIDGLMKIGRRVGDFPLFMEDESVSRSHCELFWSDKKLMLRDYSTHGTTVGDKHINNTQIQVENGSVVILGSQQQSVKITW